MPRRIEPQAGLGQAVKHLRKEAGLTQEAVAKVGDLHLTWISQVENETVNPTWANVRRLARGLGVPLGELAELAEEKERER